MLDEIQVKIYDFNTKHELLYMMEVIIKGDCYEVTIYDNSLESVWSETVYNVSDLIDIALSDWS